MMKDPRVDVVIMRGRRSGGLEGIEREKIRKSIEMVRLAVG
jgi:hypothetical protein